MPSHLVHHGALTSHNSLNSCIQVHHDQWSVLFIIDILPRPKQHVGIFGNTAENDTAGWDERTVLERGGKDTVFLRKENGCNELCGFGLCVIANDPVMTELACQIQCRDE
jgi:hypothetical protein